MKYVIYSVSDMTAPAPRDTLIVYADMSEAWDDNMAKIHGLCEVRGIGLEGMQVSVIGVSDSLVVRV